MNTEYANSLASDMISRAVHSKDFWSKVGEFSHLQSSLPEEYAYAVKTAISHRKPYEKDITSFLNEARNFLTDKGVKF